MDNSAGEPVFAAAIERQVYLQEKLNKFELIDEAYYFLDKTLI